MPQSLPGCAPADPAQSARATVKTLLVNVRPTSLMVVPPPWCAVAPVLDARRPCRPEGGGLSRGTLSGPEVTDRVSSPAAAGACYDSPYHGSHGDPMAHTGMKFGIFLAPFHRVGENPTLALARDMELIEETLGRPPGRADDPLREGVRMGTTLVGSPETVVRGIERLQQFSQGGFGGLLFRAHEWANREQTLRSYELFARYVMPRFQGSLDTVRASNEWARANRKTIFGPNVEAVRRAYLDAGREIPAEYKERTSGARDVDPPPRAP